MNRAILTLALIGALSFGLIGANNAYAAVDYFMKIDGINGEATNSMRPSETEGWIQIDSIQWAISRGLITPSGSSAARESSAPSISDVTVTKLTDSTSAKLMQESCCGGPKNVKIDFVVEAGDDTPARYYTLTLENAQITAYNMNAGEKPSESITMTYTKITYNYKEGPNPGENPDTFEISKKPGHR